MEIFRRLHGTRGGLGGVHSGVPRGSRHCSRGIRVGPVVILLNGVIGGSVGGAIGVGALLDGLDQAGVGLEEQSPVNLSSIANGSIN